MTLRLFATPLSHFARKVRILLAELELDHELVWTENLLSEDPADFGGNPILRIPTLVDGDTWVVESDQIARYLVERHDPADRFGVLALDVAQRNTLASINAAMGALEHRPRPKCGAICPEPGGSGRAKAILCGPKLNATIGRIARESQEEPCESE